MSLIQFDSVTLEYGEQVLLRDAELSLDSGERVCLVGRNGAGKTTSFKLITGVVEPDRGIVERRPDVRIAELAQTLPAETGVSVTEVVRGGLQDIEQLRVQYEALVHSELDAKQIKTLEEVQKRLDAADGWHLEQRVEAIITELGLPADKNLDELSAGWRRRVSLARALVCKPDVLLLDEPTNHLDFSTVEWLESRIQGFDGCVFFISHDRHFVARLATRIVELDRGRLRSWPGSYDRFIELRDKALVDEDARNSLFDKKLAEEEAWIREGIKARRTRNQGRVRALQSMREQHAARIKLERSANINIDVAEQSGRKVAELKNVGHGYEGRRLFHDFSLKIMRGDRIGIVGNNGVGKSTLARVVLGELEPDEGNVRLGTNLEVGYFDPVNTPLPLDRTVADFVGEGRDFIPAGGKDRHIISYLNGFLFSAKRARTRLGSLSGGERNRVLLAKVFTKPSNLLVLDEPTNDLDVETLEVLEDRLVEYDGTLLVVSHDRLFLDNVVTSVLVFERDAGVQAYVGGYSEWHRRGIALRELDNPDKREMKLAEKSARAPRSPPKRAKLSYKLKRELEALPDEIEQLEQQIDALQEQTAAAGFYDQPYEQVEGVLKSLAALTSRLEQLMDRWGELESLEGGSDQG